MFFTCWAISNFCLVFLYCNFFFFFFFLSSVLEFVFNSFYNKIFLFYFYKLIFWNWNIIQIMYVFFLPSTPVSSTYMSIIPIKSIGSKDDLVLWLNFWIFSWETILFRLFAITIFALVFVKTLGWSANLIHHYKVNKYQEQDQKRVLSMNYYRAHGNGSMIESAVFTWNLLLWKFLSRQLEASF